MNGREKLKYLHETQPNNFNIKPLKLQYTETKCIVKISSKHLKKKRTKYLLFLIA